MCGRFALKAPPAGIISHFGVDAEPDSFVNRVLAQPVLPLIGKLHEPSRAG